MTTIDCSSGQYRPGDSLRKAALAASLGVSRGTVRQALRQLQQEGLVTAGDRSMIRVSRLSAEEVRELFRVRAALEGRLRVVIVAAGPLRTQHSMSHERHTATVDTIESGCSTAALVAIDEHMAFATDCLAARAH